MRLLGGFYSRKLFGRERGIKNRPIKISKNTIPLIIIAIAVICFGLGGLALVIYNIKNDEKDGDPDDSSKEEH
jgi:hypothetical protein